MSRYRQDTTLTTARKRVDDEMAMTYEEVARRLGRQAVVQIDKRRGTEFRIAPTHMDLHQNPDTIEAQPDLQIRYHGTPLVTLHPDHTYTLRTGGLATKTALRRISQYAPVTLTTRGGTVFLMDPKRGEVTRPFEEGMRVDRHGHEVPALEAPPMNGDAKDHDTPDIAALIARELDKRLADYGLRPKHTPTTVKAVRMRSVLQPKHEPTDPDAPDVADIVAQTMRANGLPEDQVRRVTRDLRGALTRGRDPEHDTAIPPKVRRAPQASTVRILRCPDCKGDLRLHYDGANRFRGCAWAAKKASE